MNLFHMLLLLKLVKIYYIRLNISKSFPSIVIEILSNYLPINSIKQLIDSYKNFKKHYKIIETCKTKPYFYKGLGTEIEQLLK